MGETLSLYTYIDILSMYIMDLILSKKGSLKGRFTIKLLVFTDGKIAPCGNSYHLTIRKDIAKEIGPGKRIGVILFEQGSGDGSVYSK